MELLMYKIVNACPKLLVLHYHHHIRNYYFTHPMLETLWGAVGRMLDCQFRGPRFESTYCRFENWAISFTPLCLHALHAEETLSHWSLLPCAYV